MSEYAEEHRKAMKEKARRLAGGTDPHQKVDASSWTPPEPINAGAKTGMRPVSKRQFKSGGKVAGEEAMHHAGRKKRQSGGKALTPDNLINRNAKEANEKRGGGNAHKGGYAAGGAPMSSSRPMPRPSDVAPKSSPRPPMSREDALTQEGLDAFNDQGIPKKRGGKVGKKAWEASAEDKKQDKALAKKSGMSMKKWEKSSEDEAHDYGRKSGGRANWIQKAIKHPGALHRELHVPEGEKIPAKKLAAAAKKPGKEGERARLAENLKRMNRASGGQTGKGKTTVNVIIAEKQPGMGAGPMPVPPMPPVGPAAAPPMGAEAMPKMGPGAPAMPQMGPGAPAMPRKDGGRAYPKMHYGAGSGEGRLEKVEEYGHKARK